MTADRQSREQAERLISVLHEHWIDSPLDELERVVHPDAEMWLLVSYGELVRGREAVLRALHHGQDAQAFRAHVERFEWLDESSCLTSGTARYPLRNGGFADGKIYWLDQMRDGMIWRACMFKTEQEARDLYAGGPHAWEELATSARRVPLE